MAPLPADRMTKVMPFGIIVMDFVEPLNAREEKDSKVTKFCAVIFTSAVTGAVKLG